MNGGMSSEYEYEYEYEYGGYSITSLSLPYVISTFQPCLMLSRYLDYTASCMADRPFDVRQN